MEELWKPIKKYNDYYISNCGRVFNMTKSNFVSVKHNFVYVSKVNKKGKHQHATLSVKRMLLEYFNIDTYTNKPKTIFYTNKKLKHNKDKKGKPIDNNFYDIMEKLENEYGCLNNIPSDDKCLQILWDYFN